MHDQYHPPGLDPATYGNRNRYPGLLPALLGATVLAAIIAALVVGLVLGQPATRQVIAQSICAQGDRIEAVLPWSSTGQSLGAWCVGEDGQHSPSFLPWLYLGAFVLIFDACVIVAIFRARRRARESMSLPGATAAFESPPSGTPRMFQSIIVNGRAYNSPDEMPPEVRQVFSQMQGMFTDTNNNGMPDMFEGKGLGDLTQQIAQWGAATTGDPGGDPAERLQKLKELRDSGLISEEEYQAKKAEILSAM